MSLIFFQGGIRLSFSKNPLGVRSSSFPDLKASMSEQPLFASPQVSSALPGPFANTQRGLPKPQAPGVKTSHGPGSGSLFGFQDAQQHVDLSIFANGSHLLAGSSANNLAHTSIGSSKSGVIGSSLPTTVAIGSHGFASKPSGPQASTTANSHGSITTSGMPSHLSHFAQSFDSRVGGLGVGFSNGPSLGMGLSASSEGHRDPTLSSGY
jgi:hypothetical protein